MRETLRIENPNISAVDVMKDISSRWAHMDSESRAPYTHLANEDRKRYENEISLIKSEHDDQTEVNETWWTPDIAKPISVKFGKCLSNFQTLDSPNKSVLHLSESVEGE